MSDPVNLPDHYRAYPGVEVIDLTKHMNFCLGNVVKYVARADHKGNPMEDLAKARRYLDIEIERREQLGDIFPEVQVPDSQPTWACDAEDFRNLPTDTEVEDADGDRFTKGEDGVWYSSGGRGYLLNSNEMVDYTPTRVIG